MDNRIRTFYTRGLNKGFSSKFTVGTRVRPETPEEGRWKYLPKRSDNNNKDDVKKPNILSNDNYQPQNFLQILFFLFCFNYFSMLWKHDFA